MTAQGPYDPNLFVDGSFATYPVITDPPAGELYQPGMFWNFSVGGSFDGIPVTDADFVYVTGRGREFGDLLFGREVFGGPPGSDWPVELTSWVVVFGGLPWLKTPAPGSGCPVSDGWRFVLEALERDLLDPLLDTWHDITDSMAFGDIVRGQPVAQAVFPVEQMVTDYTEQFDPFGLLQVSTFIRAGLLDPDDDYTFLSTCRIAQLSDVTDPAQPVRTRITSYGLTSDTVGIRPDWDRGPESAAARIQVIIDELGWSWAQPTFEDSPGFDMRSELKRDVALRPELDRIALSSRWTMDTSRNGTVRFRNFPLTREAPPDFLVRFVDCDMSSRFTVNAGFWTPGPSWPGQFVQLWNDANERTLWNDADDAQLWAGDDWGPYWVVDSDGTTPDGINVLAGDLVGFFNGRWWPVLTGAARTYRQTWLNDRSELLNKAYATATDNDDAEAFDQASIDLYGERSIGYGMPALNLATADDPDLDLIVGAVIARAANLVQRVGSCAVSTANGPDAWQALQLDIGDPVEVTALTPEFRRQELSMVLGVNQSVMPGDIRGRFSLTKGFDS